MKTIEQRDATFHNSGMFILITFFSIVWLSLDPDALGQLMCQLKSQWLDFSNWTSSGIMNPRRTQW